MTVRTLRTKLRASPPSGPEFASIAIDSNDDRPLLDVLRGELGVRSASRACQDGTCGACRVILDGTLVSSCGLKWGDVGEGATLETYETLAPEPAAARAVHAFEQERPTRCRMCVGALGVTAVALSRASASHPLELEQALAGATCMCTGRGSWRRALSE